MIRNELNLNNAIENSWGVGLAGAKIDLLTNYGTISGITAIYNTSMLDSTSFKATISTLNNFGAIQGSRYGIYNGFKGIIGTLNNTGTITGATSGIYTAIDAKISVLNNAQGQAGALTYLGKLPNAYSLIVRSSTDYGKFSFTDVGFAGQTSFGVNASSSLTATTYTNVLNGVLPVNLSNLTNSVLSGISGSYTWSLVNTSGTQWDLIVISNSTPDGLDESSSNALSQTISSGQTLTSSALALGQPLTLNNGGTLQLLSNSKINNPITLSTGINTITTLSGGRSVLSGVISGGGALFLNGPGTIVLSGANTYSGGTEIASSTTLSLSGFSSTGTGQVLIHAGGTLMGTGNISGDIKVSGTIKPGNSPGYLTANSAVMMNSGSIYQQDIAGTIQASLSSPSGTTGYYSYMNLTGGTFSINSDATLIPRLFNLFIPEESGYGSAPYVPKLGDQFRMLTSAGGINGRFSTLTQPDGMAVGTQFVSFYNMNNSNSIDLAVIPTSYPTTIASASGNKNAQSVGSVLDRLAQANLSATSTTAQDQLLYAISGQTSASNIASYAQSMSGEVYPAAVSVIAQTTQRVQQAVLSRMGDTMGLGLPGAMTNPVGNAALTSSTNTVLSGGVSNAAMSSNPNINTNTEATSLSNGNVWGELAFQKGHRSSDSASGGWNANLYQLVFGSDFYAANGMKIGGGLALSNTTLSPTYGSGTIQQGALFAYGKMPVQDYVVDAMASIGLNSSDLSRGDVTNLSNGFRNKSILGNDAMVSLGVSRPLDFEQVRVTPFARVTWQVVTQAGVNEGDAASALSVNRFTGNGVRGVLGVAAGSKQTNPMTEKYTYRAYVGVGADSSGVLNPTMNASLAGLGTTITTPNAGVAFVQAGLYGTAKVSDNSYVYAGLSGEARSGQTLGAVNVGLRVQF